jgi:hypothetical protein
VLARRPARGARSPGGVAPSPVLRCEAHPRRVSLSALLLEEEREAELARAADLLGPPLDHDAALHALGEVQDDATRRAREEHVLARQAGDREVPVGTDHHGPRQRQRAILESSVTAHHAEAHHLGLACATARSVGLRTRPLAHRGVGP